MITRTDDDRGPRPARPALLATLLMVGALLLAVPGAAAHAKAPEGRGVARSQAAPAPVARPQVVELGQRVTVSTRFPGPGRRTVQVQTQPVGSSAWQAGGTAQTNARGRVSVRFRPTTTMQVRMVAARARSGSRTWPRIVTAPTAVTVTREPGDPGTDPERGEFGFEALGRIRYGATTPFRVALPRSVPFGVMTLEAYYPSLGEWGYVASEVFGDDDVTVDLSVNSLMVGGAIPQFGSVALRAAVYDQKTGTTTLTTEHRVFPVSGWHNGIGALWGRVMLSANGTVLTAGVGDVASPDDPFGGWLPNSMFSTSVLGSGTPDPEADPDYRGAGFLLAVSENDRYVLYSSPDEPSSPPCGNSDLMVLDRVTGTRVRADVTPPTHGARCPYPANAEVADNGEVLFYSFALDDSTSPRWAMYLRHLDEPYARPVKDYQIEGSLSGDGQTAVLATQTPDGDRHWFLEDLASGQRIGALDDALPTSAADFPVVQDLSYDGSTALVTNYADATGLTDVYLWTRGGELLPVVTRWDAPELPVLSGDGRSVAFRRWPDLYVWHRGTGGTGTETKVDVPSLGFCSAFAVEDLSHDGRTLAYTGWWNEESDCEQSNRDYEALTLRVPAT